MCKNDIKILFDGMIIGAILGMMFAPKSGREMRECALDFMEDMDRDFIKCLDDIEKDLKDFEMVDSIKDGILKKDKIMRKTNKIVDDVIQSGNKSKKKKVKDLKEKVENVTEAVLENLK